MQKRKSTRLLALLMVIVLCFSLMPATSLAVTANSENITVYIDFEGYNLGQGFYIEPTKMTVPADWTAGQVTAALLNQEGYDFNAGGNEDGSGDEFYLTAVKDFDKGFVEFPEYITDVSDTNNLGNDDDYLGEFDYSASSGWMLTVDHVVISRGAGTFALENNSVIRWQFTVQGYGADIGLAFVDPDAQNPAGDPPLYTQENKDALVRVIADNPPPASFVLLSASPEDDFAEARANALATLIDPLATAEEIASAIEELENAVLALNPATGEPVDVTITWQPDDSGFPIAKEPITVAADLSETYGYDDDFNGSQATALDALVAAHILIFGDEDLASYLAISYGFATKEFGVAGGSYMHYINGQQPNDGNYQPDAYNGGTSAMGYSLTASSIETGDDVLFIFIQDTYYMDMYTWFEYENAKTNTITVTEGEDFDLTLTGYMNWYGYSDPAYQASKTGPVEDAQLALVEIDDAGGWNVGTFEDIDGALTDEDGIATLNFETPGTYIVSAYDVGGYAPIIAPWLEITVEEAVVDSKAALNAAIAQAEALNLNDYTTTTWNAMSAKLTAAKLVADDVTALDAAIETATNELLAALNNLVPTKTTIKVTKGATVGLYQKGSHYTPFTSFTLVKDDILSDNDYDVYTASGLPRGSATFNIQAYIPGVTAKTAQVISSANAYGKVLTLDLTPLNEWEPVNNTYMNAGLYTNLGDSGSIELEDEGVFYLDTFRVWQAMEGTVNNYFIEPYYTFDLYGDSVSIERAGAVGREQLKITAEKPGVSVIKVTYDPIKYIQNNGTVLNFNAIAPRNTGAVVVSVDGGADFDTGITLRNDFDTVYFDAADGSGEITFPPAEGTSVRVHDPLDAEDWGDGWNVYDANEDGSFTIALTEGRNIVELTNAGSVKYHVIKAIGVSVTVTNTTHPGDAFAAGDTAQIQILGLETPVEKMGGIYNPGFGAANAPYIQYKNADGAVFDSNKGGQYANLTTTFTVDYTLEDADLNVLNGQLFLGVMGSAIGAHRTIAGSGTQMNGSAGTQATTWFGALPEITLPLKPYADSGYTEELDAVLNRLISSVPSPGFGTGSGEWTVLALARGGYDVPEGYFEGYLEKIGQKLDSLTPSSTPYAVGYTVNPVNGKREVKFDATKITENERLVMALSALGIDAANFKTATATYDLIARFPDMKNASSGDWWATAQGMNGPAYALMALNSRGYANPYAIPESRNEDLHTDNPLTVDGLIDYILARECLSKSGGGFSLGNAVGGNGAADPDITSMVLQALAPYYHVEKTSGGARLLGAGFGLLGAGTEYKYPEVDAAVDRAIETLSAMQLLDGGYGSWNTVNTESIAQVVVALTMLGIDPVTDPRFQKVDAQGVINNPISALLTFFVPANGGFKHTATGSANGIATDQAAYALVAYDRFKTGKSSLYNMYDAPWADPSDYVITIAADDTDLEPGDTFTVTLTLSGRNGDPAVGEHAGYWSAWVNYDSNVLAYQSVSPSAAALDTATGGVVKLGVLGTDNDIDTSGDGSVVATLTFVVKTNATADDTEIDLDAAHLEAGGVEDDEDIDSTAAAAGGPVALDITYRYAITLPGAATEVTGVSDNKATKGTDVTFKLPPSTYEVTYTIGEGDSVTITPDVNGVYTIPGSAITGVVLVEMANFSVVGSARFINEETFRGIPADKKVMIFVPEDLDETKTYLFDGAAMYWSEKYDGGSFVFIVDASLSNVQAKVKITVSDIGTNLAINYSGDVNGDGSVKAQDAQIASSLYNGKYKTGADIVKVGDLSRLRADVNGDGKVDTTDARAIQVLSLS